MWGSIQTYAAKKLLKLIEQDPEKNLPKLLEWADRFDKDNRYPSQRQMFHQILEHPEGNWYQLIQKVFQLDTGVRDAFLENFMINATLVGQRQAEGGGQAGGLQCALGHSAGPHLRLQPALHRLLGSGVWPQPEPETWTPSTPSSARARSWGRTCTSTPAASPWCARRT